MIARGLLWALIALVLAGCRSTPHWGDLSAPCSWTLLDAAPVAIVADAPLPIVTDNTPTDRWAALFLAQTIAEASGRKPEVFVERPGQICAVSNALYIGDVAANRGWSCALTNESVEAFRVVAEKGSVRFLGRADFAVFDWCERCLGLRYYPVFGKSVLLSSNIVVAAADYSDRPVFSYRQIGGNGAWQKVSRTGVAHRGRVSVHQPQGWSADPAIKAAHPEIFENGETPMLCYGKPETLAYYKRRIDRHIAGLEDSGGIVDTNRMVVTVCQWDAPIRCACPACTPLYATHGNEAGQASPIIWGRFLRELSAWLAVAHPDYEISFLPYMNTCEVPTRLKGRLGHRRWCLLPNAEAEICTMPGLALLKNARCKAEEETILREWSRVTRRKILNWHYLCWPLEWTQAPYVFGRTIQRHYLDTADVTCGSFVCGSGDNDIRSALSAYVWTRCLWNPNFDVEALYDEFAIRAFGPAALPMRELIALQESCWERQWPDNETSWRNVFGVSYPPQDVQRMKDLVKLADRLATLADDARAALTVRAYASLFEEFVAESDDLAARASRRVIRPGLTEDMVMAQSALYPKPWAKTTVTTRVDEGDLVFDVRCEEPAVARMDFTRTVNDVVWGNDCVTFVLMDGDETRLARVMLTGEVRKPWPGFRATVTHDATGWSCRAHVALTPAMRRADAVRGNVVRWRVGDRRLPADQRVPGSRYEHSRLSTAYTRPDTDPAAFLTFALR